MHKLLLGWQILAFENVEIPRARLQNTDKEVFEHNVLKHLDLNVALLVTLGLWSLSLVKPTYYKNMVSPSIHCQ
jgi:hypothetical protein